MENTQVVTLKNTQLTAGEIRDNVNLVQSVMKAVMKEGTHYGQIPGTPKPSLWKPGAEVLASTFRIAVSYKIEELSGDDLVRYRVTAIGTHQPTSIFMGEGMGECSSNEEKYKWRKAVEAEFKDTAENRRRIKYTSQSTIKQVRTEPADMANTILKMACKRAQVAMILNVTAASDIFTQDIEDLPPELRDMDDGPRQPQKPAAHIPPNYDQYVAETLPILRDAAEHGTEALFKQFSALPQAPQKVLLWQQHGTGLKDTAAKVDSNAKSAEDA